MPTFSVPSSAVGAATAAARPVPFHDHLRATAGSDFGTAAGRGGGSSGLGKVGSPGVGDGVELSSCSFTPLGLSSAVGSLLERRRLGSGAECRGDGGTNDNDTTVGEPAVRVRLLFVRVVAAPLEVAFTGTSISVFA